MASGPFLPPWRTARALLLADAIPRVQYRNLPERDRGSSGTHLRLLVQLLFRTRFEPLNWRICGIGPAHLFEGGVHVALTERDAEARLGISALVENPPRAWTIVKGAVGMGAQL